MAKLGFLQLIKRQFGDNNDIEILLGDIASKSGKVEADSPEKLDSWQKLLKMSVELRREAIIHLIVAIDVNPDYGETWVKQLILALLPGQSETGWLSFIQHIEMMRDIDAQFELSFLFVNFINEEIPDLKSQYYTIFITVSLRHLYIKLKKRASRPTEFQLKTLDMLETSAVSNADGLYRELMEDRFYKELSPVINQLLNIDGGQTREFFKICLRYDNKSGPEQKWKIEVAKTMQEVNRTIFAEKALSLIEMWCELLRSEHKNLPNQREMWVYKLDIPAWVSPFVWYAGLYLYEEPGIRKALSNFADLSFKKVPGIGSLSVGAGIACIHAFSLMPDNSGIVHILRQQNKVVNKTAKSAIEKILKKIASKNNLTTGELMELAIPDFELDENGLRSFDFGDYEAIVSIEGSSRVQIKWFQKKGEKLLKSAPAVVKKEFRDEYKALSATQAEIKDALGGISKTLESAWLEKRVWTYIQLEKRLLDHPLLKFVARRIIWRLESGSKTADAIFFGGRWQNPAGENFDWITPETRVTLWHPIYASADEVLAWRNWLEQREITQPFKQAYREVYVVTPPEIRTNSYSNRFAAHVLRQHQFAALCGLRGWSYKLQGNFYNPVTPHKDVPVWDYRIEFWTETNDLDDTLDSGIYQYIYTDQVRFSHQGRQVNMPDVPPIVFSELMRDVDLFVGVCSIGNDPDWQDSGNQRFRDYWRGYAFAEELSASGEIRLEALKKMIPRLKIASQCRFEGRYLLVQGSRHLYKIHCGSGNILMSPNDKYLCIVPDQAARREKEPIYLPFEGDTLLSVIISKAILLASDEKITDPTILLQL